MNVLFVYSNIICACTKKCCTELSKALKRYANTDVIYYAELNNDIIKDYDIVILQRIGVGKTIEENFKQQIFKIIDTNKNTKFIYMIDDLILDTQDGLPKKLAEKCDGLICFNELLRDYFSQYNNNIYTLHTFIDIELYDSVEKYNFNKFTVVWASTAGLGINLINQIIDLKANCGIDFDLIALGTRSTLLKHDNNISIYPIIPEEEMISIIKGADLLLNPMTPDQFINDAITKIYNSDVNDFLNSKSEVKYAISGMCKTCLLTTGQRAYKRCIKNGVNGFILSDNPNEWISLIEYLYYNDEYKNKIALNAYNNVKQEYDILLVANKLYKILGEI